MSAEKKLLPIKEMLFTYLAISKILYWINIIGGANDFAALSDAVRER